MPDQEQATRPAAVDFSDRATEDRTTEDRTTPVASDEDPATPVASDDDRAATVTEVQDADGSVGDTADHDVSVGTVPVETPAEAASYESAPAEPTTYEAASHDPASPSTDGSYAGSSNVDYSTTGASHVDTGADEDLADADTAQVGSAPSDAHEAPPTAAGFDPTPSDYEAPSVTTPDSDAAASETAPADTPPYGTVSYGTLPGAVSNGDAADADERASTAVEPKMATPDTTASYPDSDSDTTKGATPEWANAATPSAYAAPSSAGTTDTGAETDFATVEPGAPVPYAADPDRDVVDAQVVESTPDGAVTPVAEDEDVAGSAGSGELSPGDVEFVPVKELWPAASADTLRERWRELQLRFVDDPHGAAEDADSLVGEAIDTLTSALASTREDLAGWRSAGDGDTEQLRVAVQRYRQFLDGVLGL